MLVLFIGVVLAGCITPFFIDENNRKDMIVSYSIILGDTILIILLAVAKIAYIPWLETQESIAVGIGFVLLGVLWARIHRMLNPKKVSFAPKTHHQRTLEQQQNNHKAAS